MKVKITNGDGISTEYNVEDAIEKSRGYATGDIEIEEQIDVVSEGLRILRNMLYNAIIGWYDDSLEEYSGLEDEDFVHEVCKKLGLSRKEYAELMHINFEEEKNNNGDN